jgi:mycoredoxin-dependent peroxiredoxin
VTVEIGRAAPDFALRDQHGATVSLSSYREEEKAVAVMFYPYAFSGVCTGELTAVRDSMARFESASTALVAISCDPMFSLRAFADRDGLTFPLLSDFWPHGAVATAYDVFDSERGCARRSTFIVDKQGLLRWSVHNEMPQARDIAEQARVLAGVA